MIVLDLEWNQPFGGRRMEEIIQIGAVRLARPGGPVVDAFNAHIRPSIYQKLSPVAKKLPESAQALTSELDFPAAYQAFLDWCGEDTLWAEWGAQDHGVLAANAAYWKLPAPPVTACIDLQAAFCRTLEIGLGRRIALEQAAEYCGLPLIYEFHNALHDALYAALITAWLTESSLLPTAPRAEAKHKRRRGVKFSRETYPKQPRQKITPLPEREQLLNSRQARIVPCPLCRQPGAVESWYPQGDVYYGVFRCENHGLFPVRMSVVHREDGSWQGRRVVPPLTDPERAAFAAARENEPFHCTREKAKRRRRHRKAKGTREAFPCQGEPQKNRRAAVLLRFSIPGGGIIKCKKRSTPKRKIIYIISGRQARDN